MADVLKVLKTWCNGWAASNRYHNDIRLPCVVGCSEQRDDMKHYLDGPHLFALQKFMIPATSPDPLIRWSIINPCIESCKQVACTHCGYHAARRHLKGALAQDFPATKLGGGASTQPSAPVQGLSLDPPPKIGRSGDKVPNFTSALIRTSWIVFAEARHAEVIELNVNTFKFSVSIF